MIGLAMMVSNLSLQRTWKTQFPDYQINWPRATPPYRNCGCDACKEYYAILDRLTRGEKP